MFMTNESLSINYTTKLKINEKYFFVIKSLTDIRMSMGLVIYNIRIDVYIFIIQIHFSFVLKI